MSLIDDSKLENSERNIDGMSHHPSYYDDIVHLEEEALELSANLREKNGDIRDYKDCIICLPHHRHSPRWRNPYKSRSRVTPYKPDRLNTLSSINTINESGDIIQCPFKSRYEYIYIDRDTLTSGTFIPEEDTDLDIIAISPELSTLIKYADALGLLEDVKDDNSITILQVFERVAEYGLEHDEKGRPVDEPPVLMVEENIYGEPLSKND